VDAARRAVRLDPRNGRAQLTLSQALARTGDAPGALQAAGAAFHLLGGLPEAREALADAEWLSDQDAAAFGEFRALVKLLSSKEDRRRVTAKARALYLQHAGWFGRMVAWVPALFGLAFRNGWLHV
jgi:Flp pilus assembly protein TadD